MKTWNFPRSALAAAVVGATLFCASVSFAQVYDYGAYAISNHDRVILRDFIVNAHARRCHENETRRIEPCGVASRMIVSFRPGSVLPQDVPDEVVPRRVLARVAPAPHGAAYVYAGDNVYLIDVLSRRIIDAVPMATE